MGTLQDPVNNKLSARPPTPIPSPLDVEAGFARARSFLDQKQNAHKPGGVDEERTAKEKARAGVGGRVDEKKARGSVGYGDEKKVRGSVGHGDHEKKARGRSVAGHGDEEKARGHISVAGHGDEKRTRENSGHGDEKKVKGSTGHGIKKKARGSVGQGEEKKARGGVRVDGDQEKEASEEKKACEEKKGTKGKEEGIVDYVRRGQWLRAAILGANDGLVSTASLMMGVGAVKDDDARPMVVSGLAGLVGGACSMAIGEFVSVYSQRDAEKHDKKRREEREGTGGGDHQSRDKKASKELVVDNDMEANVTQEGGEKSGKDESEVEGSSVGPSPWEAAGASGLSFALGAMVPLLSASFIKNQTARMGVMMGVCSAALICMGAAGSKLSAGSVTKGGARVLLGGWAAMLVTFGLLRLFASSGM